MHLEAFHLFLWTMSGIALVVFITLYFVEAGYGMLFNSRWGKAIPNKIAVMVV